MWSRLSFVVLLGKNDFSCRPTRFAFTFVLFNIQQLQGIVIVYLGLCERLPHSTQQWQFHHETFFGRFCYRRESLCFQKAPLGASLFGAFSCLIFSKTIAGLLLRRSPPSHKQTHNTFISASVFSPNYFMLPFLFFISMCFADSVCHFIFSQWEGESSGHRPNLDINVIYRRASFWSARIDWGAHGFISSFHEHELIIFWACW